MATVSSSIRARVNALLKTAAEDEAKPKTCPECGASCSGSQCDKCGCQLKNGTEKESMGTASMGGYDTSGSSDSSGMNVTASAPLTAQLDKAAI